MEEGFNSASLYQGFKLKGIVVYALCSTAELDAIVVVLHTSDFLVSCSTWQVTPIIKGYTSLQTHLSSQCSAALLTFAE